MIIQWGYISNQGFGGNHFTTTYYPRAFTQDAYYITRSPLSTTTTDCGTSHCLYIAGRDLTCFTHYDTYYNMVQGWKWTAFGY